MPDSVIPLIEFRIEVPDFRTPRGRRYSLVAILALACAAMLCGYRSYSAMAEWSRNYGAALAQALGFRRPTTPCAATLHFVFGHLDVVRFEACLGRWTQQVLSARTSRPPAAMAADGKSLRGSQKAGAPGAHLLAAVSQQLGLTLGQCAVGDETNELSAVYDLLDQLVLRGRIITADAMHTQRNFAQAVVDAGGA
jgi:hypothetical protein